MTNPSPIETEVKIEIETGGLEEIRTRLLSLGAECVWDRLREENVLFDFPDRRLRERGCALRLRRYGDRNTLTFKGKILDNPYFKQRPEIQTTLEDAAVLRSILEALGLQAAFQYAKVRSVYRMVGEDLDVIFCLDETPVGEFVEIEGEADQIERAARLFGWSPSVFLRKNYVELYQERTAR